MGKLVGFIVVIIFIIFTFLTAYNLYQNSYAIEDIKYSISLSCKALANSIENSQKNFEELSQGHYGVVEEKIYVDRDRLLEEFYDSLYLNYYNEEIFSKIKKNLFAKILVYEDKFFVAGVDDRWSPPYFFTKEVAGTIVYLNSSNQSVYYYDLMGVKRNDKNISDFGITLKEKQEIIIEKLNSIVSQYTFSNIRQNGLEIQTYNPFNNEGDYQKSHSRFNVLDNLTFFVIFAEDEKLYIDNKEFRYKNYNVVGYTMYRHSRKIQ